MGEQELCLRHLVKNRLVSAEATVYDADTYFEDELDGDCEDCAGYEDCPVIAAQEECE